MRILFLIDRVLPVGASGIAALQIKSASEAGHNVTLLTTYESRIDSELKACLDDVIWVDGLGNARVDDLATELERALKSLNRQVDFGSYDVVISHNFGRFGGVRALEAAARSTPLIVWCHDDYPWAGYHYEFQNYSGELVRTYEPWDAGRMGAAKHLEVLSSLRRAIFVSPSRWLHDRVAAATAQCSGILPMHIPNGIDLDEFSTGENFLPFEKEGSQLRILFIGTIDDPRKNIIVGLKELGKALSPQQAAMCEIIHVGANPDRYQKPKLLRATSFKATSSFLRAQGVPGHIVSALRLAGLVNSQRAIATLVRGAEIVVHLSQAENYPTVCLEARAAGARVIASDAGGTSETLGSEDFLVPLPLEEGAVSSIMAELIESYGDPVIDIPNVTGLYDPRAVAAAPSVLSVDEMWSRLERIISAAIPASQMKQ